MFSEDYSSAAPPSAPQTPRAHQLLSASYAALSSMAQGSASAAAASRLHEALAAAAAAPRADAQQSTLGAAIAGKERELRDMHEFRVASLEALLRARVGEIAAARAAAADAVAAAADARADAADARARLAKLKDDFVKAVKPLIEKILGVKSFFDHLVITTTIAPPGCKRCRGPDVYHSYTLSKISGLVAANAASCSE